MPELVPGARVTPLAGLAQRVTQAARYVISGVTPQSWFGPMQPLAPMAPQDEAAGVRGRRFDYSTGINLNYIPRSTEGIKFDDLRQLSYNCDVLRAVIEARKDQMAALDWIIRPRQAPSGYEPHLWYRQGAVAHKDIPNEQQKRIDAATQFLQYPDRRTPWDQWMREWLETVFVIDAASLWRRRSRDGSLYALEWIDGATIKPLLGADGRAPPSPSPAYQQILHGVPAADWTDEELLYLPWNIRTDHIYGYSKVEQILVTINTFIRRAMFQLKYYTEGSQPDAFMGLPREWNLQNIRDFQEWMDSLLIGNLAQRRHIRFVPGEFKYQETKSPPLKDQYDEFLARIVCFTFAVAPDPFIEHVSRGAVEKSHTRALEEGLEPTQRYIKGVMDRILLEDFESPDLEFKYIEDREQDPEAQMKIDTGYTDNAIYSIDEVRIARGKPPLGGPFAVPMVKTTTGYVPVGALTAPGGIQTALAIAGGPAARAVEGVKNTREPNGGTNPNNETQTNKAFLNSELKHVLQKLAEGSGAIDPATARPVDLPIANDEQRAQVEHEAWRRVQTNTFKIINREVPLSRIVATQSIVDGPRVEDHAEQYAEEGGYPLPPITLQLSDKYYILDGHHRVEGAKQAGAKRLLIACLESSSVSALSSLPTSSLSIPGDLAVLESELAPLARKETHA